MSNPKLDGKKVLFIGGANGKDDWMIAIAQELELQNHTTSYYYNPLKGGKEYLMSKGIPPENIDSFYHEDQKEIIIPNLKFIEEAEKKYHFKTWDLWQITAPRKKSRLKLKDTTILNWTEFVIKKTEALIERWHPDYVILQGMASFAIVLVHNALKENGVQILTITNARVPQRFTLCNNLEDRWPLLLQEYNNLKNRELTPQEITAAKEFIQNFKDKPSRPDDSAKKKVSFNQKMGKYLLYLKIIRHRKQLPALKQFIWPVANKFLDLTNTFEMPVAGEQYVFYALHVDPEASTSLFGGLYVNQLDIVEKIAKSLPCNYKLYVKEHLFNYSSRPLYFRKEIKKFPNVRLISPHASSINLIKNSSLVLTVTGTVGWEAIIFQKPVITFGRIYYNLFEEVAPISEISKLPQLIEQKVSTTTDEKKTLKFITAIFKAT